MPADLEYFFCHERKADTTVAQHSHTYYEIAYYYEGNGTTEIEGEQWGYRAGQYALYAPGCVHDELHASFVKVYCLGFYLAPDSEFVLCSGVFSDMDHQIWGQIKKIRQELERKEAYYHLAGSLCLNEILILHQRRQCRTVDTFSPLHYARRYIDENATQEISLSSVAQMAGYSYDRFRHLFREETGLPPRKYILLRRIEHAKTLLADTQKPISEIAELCGFANDSRFSVLFKKQLGVSPTEFRRSGGSVGEIAKL